MKDDPRTSAIPVLAAALGLTEHANLPAFFPRRRTRFRGGAGRGRARLQFVQRAPQQRQLTRVDAVEVGPELQDAVGGDPRRPEFPFTDYAIAHARIAQIPADRVVNCWEAGKFENWLQDRQGAARPRRTHKGHEGTKATKAMP